MRWMKWISLALLAAPLAAQSTRPAAPVAQAPPTVVQPAEASPLPAPLIRLPGQGPLTLRGVVRDWENKPLAGVPLTLRVNGLELACVSGGDGAYAFFVGFGWAGQVAAGPDWRLVPHPSPDGTVDQAAYRNLRVGAGEKFPVPQAVAAALRPGDIVYLKPGVYKAAVGDNKRVLKLTNLHGTEAAPITFAAADPANPPVFDGDVGNGNLIAVEIIDCSWIVVSGLEIRNYRFAGVDVLASAPGACNNVTVERCRVHDKHPNSTGWGYAIRAKGPVHRATFRKNYVHHWSAGIALWESPEQTAVSCFVPPRKGNTAPGSPPGGYPADLPESEWDAWEGWTLIAPRWCVIEDNLCHNNTSNGGPQNADNFVTRYAIDCVVRNNVGFNEWYGASETIDDHFDMTGATRMRFYGNIAFNCTYLPPYPPVTGSGNGMKIGVRGALDPLVHHNVSFHNYRMGLDMGYSVRPRVLNNTIYWHSSAAGGHHKGGDYGIFFEGKSALAGVTCLNNVVVESRQSGIGAQPWVRLDRMDYNCVYAEGASNYRAAQGPHAVLADPLFNDPNIYIDTNFRAGWTIEQKLAYVRGQVGLRLTPRAGSPCIDAGVVIPGVTDGYAGGAPDMGAFETKEKE